MKQGSGKKKVPKKSKIQKITIVTSASFSKEALETEKELKKLGFKVLVPITARKMKQQGNYDVSFYKTWYKNPNDYSRKAFLMRNHIDKVVKADAILVMNLKKNGIDGYIGGNSLVEMAIAFYFRKPIFILNEIAEDSPFYEEVLGVLPVFLNGDLTKILFNQPN
jgi:hypothetical protein